jgi:hypothetical protein
MAFGSYNTGIATVSPANDTTSIYQTTVSPVAAGSTAVWATATMRRTMSGLGARVNKIVYDWGRRN